MAKNLRIIDTVSIPSGGTVSTTVAMQGNRCPIAILTPAAINGANFTFQGSVDDNSYFQIFDEGSAYSIAVGTNRFIGLKRQPFEGVRFLRVVSDSAEAASRTITVINGEY